MLLQTMNRLALSVFLCAMISGRCQASFVVEQESHVENSEVQLFDYQRPINAWYDQYVSVLPYEQKQMIRSVLLWMITYTAFNTSIRHLISVGTGFAAAAQRAMSQNKESDHYIEKAQYAFGEAQKIRAAERSAHLQMNELLQNIEANPDLDAAAQALEMVRINVQDLLTQFINQDAISI